VAIRDTTTSAYAASKTINQTNSTAWISSQNANMAAAHYSRDSRYFCTTKPPIEWPITTGLVGGLSATESTSST
jgi:hypothetical protein